MVDNSEVEFKVQLAALKSEWDSKALGFFDWFEKNMSATICKCYLIEQREKFGTIGRVTNNDCEIWNKLMKKHLDGRQEKVHVVINKLETIIDSKQLLMSPFKLR